MTTTTEVEVSEEVCSDIQRAELRLDPKLMRYDPGADKTLGTLCRNVVQAIKMGDKDAALDFLDDFLEKDWGVVKNCKFAKDVKGLVWGVACKMVDDEEEDDDTCICFQAPEMRRDPDAPCPLHGG